MFIKDYYIGEVWFASVMKIEDYYHIFAPTVNYEIKNNRYIFKSEAASAISKLLPPNSRKDIKELDPFHGPKLYNALALKPL